MTKKIDENSEAKQRMREFLKTRGIDLRTAERMCGYRRGFLSAGGVVGSDKLAMFASAFPDCNLHLIITGMFREPRQLAAKKAIAELKARSRSLSRDIEALEELVTSMVT